MDLYQQFREMVSHVCRDVALLRLYKDLGFGYKDITNTIYTCIQ